MKEYILEKCRLSGSQCYYAPPTKDECKGCSWWIYDNKKEVNK